MPPTHPPSVDCSKAVALMLFDLIWLCDDSPQKRFLYITHIVFMLVMSPPFRVGRHIVFARVISPSVCLFVRHKTVSAL